MVISAYFKGSCTTKKFSFRPFLIWLLSFCEKVSLFSVMVLEGCRTDFADIQNKKECGGNRQWQNHYLRNWAANTKGKGII